MNIAAYDLIGDLWADHLAFLKEAEAASPVSQRGESRAVRASLLALSAHFEGVIFGLHDKLKGADTDYQGLLNDWQISNPKRKLKDIGTYEVAELISQLTPSELGSLSVPDDIRASRNLIIHPAKVKYSYSLDQLYRLRSEELRSISTQVDIWLAHVCQAFDYERTLQTEKLVRDLDSRLGSVLESTIDSPPIQEC